MGNQRSGRRRLPTETKRLRGTRIRHDVSREPTWGGPGRPPMAPHLADDPAAVEKYEQVCTLLEDSKVLAKGHGDLVAIYAEAWADYQRKRAEWALMGRKSVIVQTWDDIQGKHRSRIVDNPLVKQLRTQADLLLRLAGEMGLTPAAASKVLMQGGEADDPFDDFLAGPKVLPFSKKG